MNFALELILIIFAFLLGIHCDQDIDWFQAINPYSRCTNDNEEYDECGSFCPETCDNYGKVRPCITLCKPGCFCKKGFVRNSQGLCVLPKQCSEVRNPNSLPSETLLFRKTHRCITPNEEYSRCGSSCPDTCNNFGVPRYCLAVCVEGCFCKPGYVRDSKSDEQSCILPEQCTNPPVCNRSREFYNHCGTVCPLTCDNYQNPPGCPKICKSGCFCEEGYVRDENWNCVKPETCPSSRENVCRFKNEKLAECDCELKCTGRKHGSYAYHCSKKCVKSCVCKKGLARHPINGSCIPVKTCPKIF